MLVSEIIFIVAVIFLMILEDKFFRVIITVDKHQDLGTSFISSIIVIQ